jgi:hypothetical protein
METFRVDMRERQGETRRVRSGNEMLSQVRNNIINFDQTVEYGEWLTIGSFTNWGDCFDEKPNLIKRILGDNMKPRTGLILIAVIFILAGSFDYADELNSQKHTQYTQGE